MKTLAWILGVIALLASITLGVNWRLATRGAAQAVAAEKKFAEDAENYRFAAVMRRETLVTSIQNDRVEMRNAELQEDIAHLEGKSAAAARRSFTLAQAMESADEMQLSLTDDMTRLAGGDYDQMKSEERRQAAQASVAVWTASLVRDRQVLYVLGALWLAFGFAAALASQRGAGRPAQGPAV